MSWAIGYDSTWNRDIGYGVPAICDHPGCGAEIDRGLSYVCGGEPYGGERGCGLFFCAKHLGGGVYPDQRCERCRNRKKPFIPTPDMTKWIQHKLTDESWREWRESYPDEVTALNAEINTR